MAALKGSVRRAREPLHLRRHAASESDESDESCRYQSSHVSSSSPGHAARTRSLYLSPAFIADRAVAVAGLVRRRIAEAPPNPVHWPRRCRRRCTFRRSSANARSSTAGACSRPNPSTRTRSSSTTPASSSPTRRATLREDHYLNQGCIWVFRVNRTWSRDANVGGNVARFINHSCVPNCYSAVDGQDDLDPRRQAHRARRRADLRLQHRGRQDHPMSLPARLQDQALTASARPAPCRGGACSPWASRSALMADADRATFAAARPGVRPSADRCGARRRASPAALRQSQAWHARDRRTARWQAAADDPCRRGAPGGRVRVETLPLESTWRG